MLKQTDRGAERFVVVPRLSVPVGTPNPTETLHVPDRCAARRSPARSRERHRGGGHCWPWRARVSSRSGRARAISRPPTSSTRRLCEVLASRRDLLHLAGAAFPSCAEALVRHQQTPFRPGFLAGRIHRHQSAACRRSCWRWRRRRGAGDEAILPGAGLLNFAAAAGVAGATPAPGCSSSGNGGRSRGRSPAADAAIGAAHQGHLRQHASQPHRLDGRHRDAEGAARLKRVGRDSGSSPTRSTALFHYGGRRAPSFMDIMEPEDRILFVNWGGGGGAMTGWRIGWLRTHPSLGRMFENLIQYSSSGRRAFPQRGAIAALDEGDAFLAQQIGQAQAARDRSAGGSFRKRARCASACRLAPSICSSRWTERRNGEYRRRLRRSVEMPARWTGARHRLRQGGRGVSEALLPPPPRPGRGGAADRLAEWIRKVEAFQPPDLGTSSGMMRSDVATAGRPAEP